MRLRWVLIGLVLFLVIGLAAALLSINRILAANQDRILAEAGKVAGRSLDVGSVSVALWGRPGVRLDGVRVGEDPAFGREDFLRARSIVVGLKLRPLLSSRLEVSRVQLIEPEIRVVRSASGRFNYASLGKGAGPTAAAGTGGGGADTPFAWVVAVADIDAGRVTYIDRSVSPARTTVLDGVQLRASDIALDRPIRFDLRAALDGASENVRLEGAVGPMGDGSAVPIEVRGAVGPWADVLPRIESLALRALQKPAELAIESLAAEVFGGSIELAGGLPLTDRGTLRLVGRGSDLGISEVVGQRSPDLAAAITGRAAFQLDLSGRGSAWPQLRETLAGTVNADVADGSLLNFNLVSEVFGQLGGVPGLPQLLSGRVRPPYDAVLGRRDTRFESLRARLDVGGGRIDAREIVITADDYGARASGSITFLQQADLRGTVELSPAFSAAVVRDVKEVAVLLNEDQKLGLPFVYRGTVGKTKPKPDLARLQPVLQRALVEAGAGNLLDKLLGSKRGERTGPDAAATPADPIGQGLRRLFGD